MSLIKNGIELLSIHIPKTGGSSFQNSLQALYGEDAFQRLDFTVREKDGRPSMKATNRTPQELLDQIYLEQELPAHIRVLHGHFHYRDFTRFFALKNDTKVVTWLRDPVRRIVSNYHFLIAQFEREVTHTPLSRQLFNRLLKSLPEFARHPRDTDLYNDYLQGRDLTDYDFVGIIECYQDELQRLGKTLGVQHISGFNVNRAQQEAPPLDAQQTDVLTDLNKENLAIYNMALAIKAESGRDRS